MTDIFRHFVEFTRSFLNDHFTLKVGRYEKLIDAKSRFYFFFRISSEQNYIYFFLLKIEFLLLRIPVYTGKLKISTENRLLYTTRNTLKRTNRKNSI